MPNHRVTRIINRCSLLLLLSLASNLYPGNSGGRLVIVAAVKHKQFTELYDYLKKHAKNFDPRYAGSLRTNGNPHDEHKNLHITLEPQHPERKMKMRAKRHSPIFPGI